jgi:uncharacterized phage protein (TIGR01671 family)
MNREIKFRGLTVDNNEFVYGRLVIVKNEQSGKKYPCIVISFDDHSFDWHEVIPNTVGQFTGLKDKNGNEIYEGDKVKGRYMVQRSLDPNSEPEIIHFEGIIKYEEGCFYVKADNGQCAFSFNYTDYELEVIGNIFQNPELLSND